MTKEGFAPYDGEWGHFSYGDKEWAEWLKEAKKLGIPVIGITDTNANPYDVDYPVPGNDDAIRAIQLYCELVSSAILDGMQAEVAAQGVKVEDTATVAAAGVAVHTAASACSARTKVPVVLKLPEIATLFTL